MPKKYKHINLPNNYISHQENYEAYRGRFFEDLPKVNFKMQGKKIQKELSSIKEFSEAKNNNLFLSNERNENDIFIKFFGRPDSNFIKKYNIDVYSKKDENTIIGKISNKKIRDGFKTDFERLESDAIKYTKTNVLRSYFGKIEDLKPLYLDEIIDKELKEYYKKQPKRKTYIDISFSSNRLNQEKYNTLKSKFKEQFIVGINTNFVHFCRMNLDFEEVKNVSLKFSGISNIGFAPIYKIAKSRVTQNLGNVNIIKNQKKDAPLIILDGPVNKDNIIIKDAILSVEYNNTHQDNSHATSVSSLAICGPNLNLSGDIIQSNCAIVINIFGNGNESIEDTVLNAVEKYVGKYKMLILNLSVNNYGDEEQPPYNRKTIDNFTKILDELSWKYNCLFFISAGNLFCWSEQVGKKVLESGYPNYFKLHVAKLLPPGDSINNITVGSIAYQTSPRSMAKIKNPSPITRGNFDDNTSIKPDFVNYDSNCFINTSGHVEAENNGVYMAGSGNNQISQDCGTSFSTPLVTYCAGIIRNNYPNYNNNTIKALLVHSADNIEAEQISDKKLKNKLVGFGMPNIDKILYSLNSSALIVVEDNIGIGKTKKIKIPIPNSISGSNRKRLRINTTVVYNPPIYPQDISLYNPIDISARLIREDGKELSGFTTRDKQSNAYSKSNVKKYRTLEWSTLKHMGKFWELQIRCENKVDDIEKINGISSDYKQKYSVILSVEDIFQDEDIDLHQEICQMIHIETPIEIEL